MDYNLYIILKKKDLKNVGIFELKNSWEGNEISYSPQKFIFEDKIQMICSEDRMLPGVKECTDNNQIILKIVNGLRELEWEVNKESDKLKFNVIVKMLQLISQLNEFSIYIFRDDEIIKQQIKFNNKKNLLLLITKALKWASPQDIRIYTDNN